MNREGDTKLLTLFVGGLIGVGGTLLLAPWSGKEAREKIKGAAEEAQGKVETAFSQAKDKVTGALDKGRGLLEKERFNIKSALDAGKEAYRRGKGAGVQQTGDADRTGAEAFNI